MIPNAIYNFALASSIYDARITYLISIVRRNVERLERSLARLEVELDHNAHASHDGCRKTLA
jgi:hypothetical protein